MITMQQNVGQTDKYIRIGAGGLLTALAVTGTVGAWGFIGLVPLASGILGTCPAYTLLGMNTNTCGASQACSAEHKTAAAEPVAFTEPEAPAATEQAASTEEAAAPAATEQAASAKETAPAAEAASAEEIDSDATERNVST